MHLTLRLAVYDALFYAIYGICIARMVMHVVPLAPVDQQRAGIPSFEAAIDLCVFPHGVKVAADDGMFCTCSYCYKLLRISDLASLVYSLLPFSEL
eukprot:scaffold87810_cov35-Prasinocladus_malaysianus.AAC.1